MYLLCAREYSKNSVVLIKDYYDPVRQVLLLPHFADEEIGAQRSSVRVQSLASGIAGVLTKADRL